jgi:hypothetical protein
MAGTPWLARLYARASVLRIAMHPYDFDDPSMVRVMARIIQRFASRRPQAFYEEVMPVRANADSPCGPPRRGPCVPSMSAPRATPANVAGT